MFYFIIITFFLFVTYTIIQSITSSEICALHLTHPSAYTHTHTHTHTHTWSSGQPTLRCPGSSWGFGALFKGLTSVVDNSCQSWDSKPQPWVTSLTLYPVGHICPQTNVFSAFNPSKCTHTWSSGGSVPCSRVSPLSRTIPARAEIRTHNLGLQHVQRSIH